VTERQQIVGDKVAAATMRGEWYRAESSGERVTLASLLRAGALVRRVWRGRTGSANAAHEYQLSDATLAAWKSVVAP
jgi:hypothetical protein